MNLLINVVISVLGASFVVYAYRQFDKKNRSLEKVKKFSDKVREDIDKYIQEKSSAIKDLAIELQVNLKTGKEILNRIKKIEADFTEKSHEINSIQGKIENYDNSIKMLIEMSGGVEENLKRIQEESQFIDSLGKQIKDSNTRINTLQKTVTSFKDEIKEHNDTELKKIAGAVRAWTEKQLKPVGEHLAKTEERVKDFAEYIARLEHKRDAVEQETMKNLDRMMNEIAVKAKTMRAQFIMDVESNFKRIVKESAEQKEELSAALYTLLDDYKQNVKLAKKEAAGTITDFDNDMATVEANYQNRLESAAARGENLEHEAFNNLKNRIETKIQSVRTDIESRFIKVNDEMKLSQKELFELFGKARSDSTIWQEEIKKIYKDAKEQMSQKIHGLDSFVRTSFGTLTKDLETINKIEKKLHSEIEHTEILVVETKKNLDAKLAQEKTESVNKINLASQEIEKEVLEKIQFRMEEFEESTEYKFKRINEINTDIEGMRKSLTDLMHSVAGKVTNDFNLTVSALNKQRDEERARADLVFKTIGEEITVLEESLEALKNKSLQSVSSQLKDFEDEFFKDLKTKNLDIQEKFTLWQKDISTKLEMLSGDYVKSVGSLQEDYSVKYEEAVGLIEEDFAKKLKKAENALTTRFAGFTEDFEKNKQTLFSTVRTAESETRDWRKLVEKDLKDTSKTIQSQMEILEQAVLDQIERIKLDFRDKTEIMIQGSRVESDEIKHEIVQLKTRIQEFKEEFKAGEQAITLELDSRRKEIQEGISAQKTAMDDTFKDLAEELKVQTLGLKNEARENMDKILKKIEERYRTVTQDLAEIQKEQKEFTNQTRLFERTDALKLELQESIGSMKKELVQLEPRLKEMQAIGGEFNNTKRLVQDLSAKLTKLLAEKRRIDSLEKNYNTLLGLSETIDAKLESVTTNYDILQVLQIKIRELEDLQKEVDSRYVRLEEKRSILEVTTKGIEKNFHVLENIEKDIQDIQKDVTALPLRLNTIEDRVGVIASHKEKADLAVEKLAMLDDLLNNVEEKMTKLQDAREWLAGTETRLQTMSKETAEQFKVIKTLYKSTDVKNLKGAPSGDKRKTVIKLAHQGWTPAEIARATDISLGEVELILELAPQKR